MPAASYYTKLHNHLQKKHMGHTLSLEEEYSNNEWRVAVKVSNVIKGEARASRKQDAQEGAALQALKCLGIPV